MLDTPQIVTPFNALWSQNVALSCDHATFNVDCCYDILQHLLRICMSSKASVKFQTIHQPKYFTCRNIFRPLIKNKTCLDCRSDNAVVLGDEGQG